jgi:diguanylate cyclase (GGDEF)-like protein
MLKRRYQAHLGLRRWQRVMNLSERFLRDRSATTIFVVAMVVVAVIGWLDFITGVRLSFGLFYLLPIAVATTYAGRPWGMAVAVTCTLVSLIGDLAIETGAGLIPFWNAVMRLGVFVVVVVVLSQLRAAHQLERRLARTDPLTGVANFRWFEEEAQREMYSSRRYGGPLSLAYLDLDDLKRLNDERGHAAGDEALRAVADTMRTHLRPTDLVARLGGDEFVVLLPHTDRLGAEDALARVSRDLSATHGISFSVGVIELDRAVGSIDDLLGRADEKMYAAKQAKRAKDGAPADVVTR